MEKKHPLCKKTKEMMKLPRLPVVREELPEILRDALESHIPHLKLQKNNFNPLLSEP